MRPFKSLLIALSISALVLALSATVAFADPATYALGGDTAGAGQLQVNGTIDPGGLQTEYWVNYFVAANTTNCNDPDPEDLANVQESPHSDFPDGVTGPQDVSVLVPGLQYETSYCYQLYATNADGSDPQDAAAYYWGDDTTGPPPVVDSASFNGRTNSIDYSLNFTPNTTQYFAAVKAEYFAKTDETCDDYTGTVNSVENDNPDGGWGGWSGFDPVAVTGTVDGLSPNTTYCIRIQGFSGNGDATTQPWTEVNTVQPVAIDINNVKLLPTEGGDPDSEAKLSFDIDDHGASVATGSSSNYDIVVYDVSADRCNDTDYYGGQEIYEGTGGSFSGDNTETIDLNGLTLGKTYCVTIDATSPWGDDYGTTVHEPVSFGKSPTVTDGSIDSGFDTITMTAASVNSGYLLTGYSLSYFAKQSDDTCSDEAATADTSYGDVQLLTDNLDSPQSVDPEITGLDQGTIYCVQLTAANSWNFAIGDWHEIKTKIQPVAATIGTLSYSPPAGPGTLDLSIDVNDNGAGDDQSSASHVSLKLFKLSSANCSAGGTASASPVDSTGADFQDLREVDLTAFSSISGGDALCAVTAVTSAWGGAYGLTHYDAFTMPAAPHFTGVSFDALGTGFTAHGTLGATWTGTAYKVEWFAPGSASCSSVPGSTNFVGTTEIDSPTTSASSNLQITLNGQSANTYLCARFVGIDDYGSSSGNYSLIKTTEAVPPSVPAGLSASNVTQTSATLSWNASTDDNGVDHYSVYAGAGSLGDTSGTSTNVTLSCGASKSFTVTATDVYGNTSAASNPIVITGAACPVTPPSNGGGTTPPPPAKQCFAPYSKTVKGKIGKKKKKFSIAITGTPSADGQSEAVKLKITGGVVAGIVVAKKKLGRSTTVTDPTGVTVTYKVGDKTKTVPLALLTAAC